MPNLRCLINLHYSSLDITYLLKHGKSMFLASGLYCNEHVEGKIKIFIVNYIKFYVVINIIIPMLGCVCQLQAERSPFFLNQEY